MAATVFAKKRVTFMPLFLEDIGRECFRGSGVNIPQVSDFEGSFCSLLQPQSVDEYLTHRKCLVNICGIINKLNSVMCCLGSFGATSEVSKVRLFIHTFVNEWTYLFKDIFVLDLIVSIY